MKIKQWLQRIPDINIRAKALANFEAHLPMYPDIISAEEDELSGAIHSGFVWTNTPEGHDFWSDYRQTVIQKEEQDHE